VKAAKVVVDPMVEAERGVLAASLAVETLAGELAKAEEAASKAAERFLRDASTIDDNVRAAMLRDRAGALHLEAIAALERAKAHKAALDRERLLAQHERDLAELPKWKDALAPLHVQLATLDAALDDLVLEYAKHVLEAQAAHDTALARAKELGLRLDLLPPRPTLEDAQLEASRSTRLAREKGNRDCLSDWLAPELGAGMWQLGDELTAAQRAQHLQVQALGTADAARTALLIAGANIAAAQLASQEAFTTNDEGE
jgi:hypothetical protein